MSEYFQQVNQRWPDCVRRIVSTDCYECFIDICGWAGEWPTLSVAWMSNGNTRYYTSLRGRFKTAWDIIWRGHYPDDMHFETKEQVVEFTDHLLEIADVVFGEEIVRIR